MPRAFGSAFARAASRSVSDRTNRRGQFDRCSGKSRLPGIRTGLVLVLFCVLRWERRYPRSKPGRSSSAHPHTGHVRRSDRTRKHNNKRA